MHWLCWKAMEGSKNSTTLKKEKKKEKKSYASCMEMSLFTVEHAIQVGGSFIVFAVTISVDHSGISFLAVVEFVQLEKDAQDVSNIVGYEKMVLPPERKRGRKICLKNEE